MRNTYEHFENLVREGLILSVKIPEQLSLSEFVKFVEPQKGLCIVPLVFDGLSLGDAICALFRYNEEELYYKMKFMYQPSLCWCALLLDIRKNTDKYYLEPVIENIRGISRIEYMRLMKEEDTMKTDKYQTFDIHVPKSLKLADIKQALENDERFTDKKVLIPVYTSITRMTDSSLTDIRISSIDPTLATIGVFERVDFKDDHAELCARILDTPISVNMTELIDATHGKCCVAVPRILGNRKKDGTIEISRIITFDIVRQSQSPFIYK